MAWVWVLVFGSGSKIQDPSRVSGLGSRVSGLASGPGLVKKPNSNPQTRLILQGANAQLKLVEEIVNQLREIQQLREPVQQSSLPPKASKVWWLFEIGDIGFKILKIQLDGDLEVFL
ncbi:hypothetical protein Q3G72_025594 [Acer saccharum]|nr:hypothetical protein Q3G72_025594 [Acer saccharum]